MDNTSYLSTRGKKKPSNLSAISIICFVECLFIFNDKQMGEKKQTLENHA